MYFQLLFLYECIQYNYYNLYYIYVRVLSILYSMNILPYILLPGCNSLITHGNCIFLAGLVQYSMYLVKMSGPRGVTSGLARTFRTGG